MKIHWTVDDDAEPLEAIDPLGDITISDEKGNSIIIECTYLDSWLDALLSGFIKIKSETKAEIVVPEEPAHVYLEKYDSGLTLSCSGVSTLSVTIDEMETALIATANEFVMEMRKLPRVETNTILSSIEDQVAYLKEKSGLI